MSKNKPKAKKSSSTSTIIKQLVKVVSSPTFFWITIGLFVANALWLALSTTYPMMFDEEFHLGIIEIYSHQLSPFISSQPPDTVFHGDLTRYGSYLFHYLMSFPFRLSGLFTTDLVSKIIFLRIINITLVVVSLWLFRKTLLLGGFSKALTHLAILFFSLIPLVSFTAAQINYDNLAMIFTAGIFLTALKAIQKSKTQVAWLISTVTLGMLGSLVKYTFLPIFLGSIVFVVFQLWRQHGNKIIVATLAKQLKNLPGVVVALLIASALLSAGLFVERYGVNLVKYHSLEPSCHKVHSKELCSQYNIWRRNTAWKGRYAKEQWPLWNPAEYTIKRWIPHIFNDLFVSGAYTGGDITIRQPLGKLEATAGVKTIRIAGWIMLVSSIIVTLIAWRKLRLKPVRYLFLTTIGLYALALWFKNYTDYLAYGIPVATQGRYFIPFLIPLMVMAGYSFSAAIKKRYLKVALFAVALLLFTQGAGATTYILYSNDQWYWQGNNTIKQSNHSAKKILQSFIFRY